MKKRLPLSIIIPTKDREKLLFKHKKSRIGIMFGPESSGLSNYDLSLSNSIIQIPTSKNLSSLNLSHAVIVVCYEIYRSTHFSKFKKEKILSKIASKNSIKNLIKFLENKIIPHGLYFFKK